MSDKRGVWAFPPDRRWQDDGISATFSPNGLTIDVGQEHAVDSYNQQFECSVTLSIHDARRLYKWLGEMLAS